MRPTHILLPALFVILPSVALAQAGGPPTFSLNEIRIDQSGGDDDEYAEITGPASTSFDGTQYLVIGDGAGDNSGVIEAFVDLSSFNTDANGMLLIAEASFTLATADETVSLNFENSDNVTHLLVRDFTGANGDDLDLDDDGTLDILPWTLVQDALGLVENVGMENQVYGASLGFTDLGPDGNFVPAHSLRCANGWRIGAFAPLGATDTPGAANFCSPGTNSFCSPGAANEVNAGGSTIQLSGSGSISANDSSLVVVNAPDRFGLFIQSDMSMASMPGAFGGNLCLTDPMVRMNVILQPSGNTATLPLDFGASSTGVEAAYNPGQTYFYQWFHRDNSTGMGGNLSAGFAVTWAP